MSEFYRECKSDKPIIAICYDFDKTLSPTDMQAQGYIQSVNYDVQTFWKESSDLAKQNGMDQNLAYMYKMKEEARGNFILNREKLEDYGSKVVLFPGVDKWFKRINKYAEEHGIITEHYIISSGLKEMIEGTSLARTGVFKKIYASSYYYDDRGEVKWPAQVVNYTGKTQYLFRISKGVLDVNDPAVNDHFEPDELRIPFRNIVYIGDSDTDIPCMKLVNTYGGHAIGVYDCTIKDKSKVQKMIHDNRISYYAAADYREGKDIDQIVKAIIDRTAENELLEQMKTKYKKETFEAYDGKTREQQIRKDIIIELETSGSFTNTHSVIKKMQEVDWNSEERELLYQIAISNQQVNWIINDPDILRFYNGLLANETKYSEAAAEVKKQLNSKGMKKSE